MLDDLYDELAYYEDLLAKVNDAQTAAEIKQTITSLLKQIKQLESLGSRWG